MWWLLLLPVSPWLYGFAVAALVSVAPTLTGKLWVAWLLIPGPFRIFGYVPLGEVEREVEWIVRIRYTTGQERATRALFAKLLADAWS